MKKIAIVTATRAEYGILTPLIKTVLSDSELELELIVTGTHLSAKHGNTVSFIEQDGFKIDHKIPILADGNAPYDISQTMANALIGFAKCFRDDRPDAVVLLGDRTEMLGIASAAMNERIPIFHIHGGEVTEGAVDDCIRHSLSKMSYLHFTSTDIYRRRVIQMGESPERVYNVGALSTENILRAPLMDERSMKISAGIPDNLKYSVVTFHPVTLDESVENQIDALCGAMDEKKEYFFLITMANSDAGGDTVNRLLENYCSTRENAVIVPNLGMIRYLSAVKFAEFVLGNSSSGIIEAPVLGTPTVNIGQRQQGRLRAETVIDCPPCKESIVEAINIAEKMPHHATLMYGDGTTSEKIVTIMKEHLINKKINLMKSFYDIEGDF